MALLSVTSSDGRSSCAREDPGLCSPSLGRTRTLGPGHLVWRLPRSEANGGCFSEKPHRAAAAQMTRLGSHTA